MNLIVEHKKSKNDKEYFALKSEYKSGKTYTHSINKQFIRTIASFLHVNIDEIPINDHIYLNMD